MTQRYYSMSDAYASIYKPKGPSIQEAIDTLVNAGLLDEEETGILNERLNESAAMDFMKNKYKGALMDPKKKSNMSDEDKKNAADQRAKNRAANFGPGGAMHKDPYKARAGESD